jgi:hypothetical protein
MEELRYGLLAPGDGQYFEELGSPGRWSAGLDEAQLMEWK